MFIAIRGGHNPKSPGASALIDEVTENRQILKWVKYYLELEKEKVIDVTPGNTDAENDLIYGVNLANQYNVDLFASIHLNKAFNNYTGALGSEVWVYSTSDNIKNDEIVAGRVVNKLASLGFKNRGIKDNLAENKRNGKDILHELKATKMASIIIEVCFVEATEDVALYKKLGPKVIGKAIAEGLLNKTITEVKEVKEMEYLVVYGNDTDKRVVEYLTEALKCGPFDGRIPYDYSKYKNIIAIGGEPANFKKFTGYTTHKVKGANQYKTALLVITLAEKINADPTKAQEFLKQYKI